MKQRIVEAIEANKEQIIACGEYVLNNPELVRRIIVLGWDTLEVYDAKTKVGVQWALKDFMNLRIK